MKKREFWLLVTPSLVVMVGLLAVPLYRTIEWSLQNVNYGDPGTFIGLSNYATALTDPRFGRAVVFTVGLTLVVTAILLVSATSWPWPSTGSPDAAPRARTAAPRVRIPGLVGATMFSWLFDSNFGGLVNYLIAYVTGQDLVVHRPLAQPR